MDFATNLKQLRIQKKLTLQEMGDLLGVSRQAYTKYENGEAEPNYENLIKIADQFNVTIDFLLGREISNKKLFIKLNNLGEQKLKALEILLE